MDTCKDCGELGLENVPVKKWKKPIVRYYCKARKGKERKPTDFGCLLFVKKGGKI